ncbi:MAG TPA: hypothetical protein VFQ07_17055, partial [Candidatus Polarisedimenticolia bacterium]|nr:hypothetical protein [Candidatus Polarisedimenticolia bacterium]
IARAAPDAVVLNLAAPLGVTTRCFVEAGVRALGVCELPGLTLERWRLRVPGREEAVLHYCGLNHLGWFWPAGAAGSAVIEAAVRAGEVDAEILERFGAAPLHYYATVFDPAAAARLGTTRRPGRAAELSSWGEAVYAAMAADPGSAIGQLAARPTPWFDRVVAPWIEVLAGSGRFADFLDLAVDGAWLPGCPTGIVAEVPAEVSGGRVTTFPQPPPPGPVSDFLLACARSQDLEYRAAASRDRRMLALAIEALPLALPAASVDPVVGRIIEGERFADLEDPLAPAS